MEPAELRQRREALGLSMNGLAREFDTTPTTVWRWERGDVILRGLMAIGADTVLKRLERRQQARQP